MHTYSKDSKHIRNRKMGFVKMIVVDDLSEATINYKAAKALNPSVNAISDDWRCYCGLTKVLGGLKQRVTPPEKAMDIYHGYIQSFRMLKI